MKSQTILLKNRPEGKPQNSDFEITETEIGNLDNDQVKLKLTYVSVDPYLRGRMRDQKSYIEPFQLNEPLVSTAVGQVVESKSDKFKKGDTVFGMLQWKEQQIADVKGLNKIEESDISDTAYLGILGLTGMTAYLGLNEIGKPKKGETLLVSGAAGAVGSTVGQIGKIMGLRVIGIAGSDEKIDLLKNKFGFDEGINYKTTDDMKAAIKEKCSDGVDIYFDNVGGEISDAVFFQINQKARIINCGAIAVYNKKETPTGVSPQPFLIKNSALMQGFIVRNYQDKFEDARNQIIKWMKDDQITFEETIKEGFNNIPDAFIGLFDGENTGKMVVKI
jgi:hypothetical protein